MKIGLVSASDNSSLLAKKISPGDTYPSITIVKWNSSPGLTSSGNCSKGFNNTSS